MKKYGLVNALKIDDNDLSIGYKHSSIDGNLEYPEVKDIAELNDLYLAGDNVFKYNTKNAISLIFANGSEHSIQDMCSDALFLKISDKRLKRYDSEILIALDSNHYMSDVQTEWILGPSNCTIIGDQRISENKFGLNNKNKMFNGYAYCQLLLDLIKTDRYWKKHEIDLKPVNYCNNLKINTLNGVYQGFLPSLHQLMHLNDYNGLINHILETFGFEKISLNRLWTCNEYIADLVYCLSKGVMIAEHKTYKVAYALPFFKKVK